MTIADTVYFEKPSRRRILGLYRSAPSQHKFGTLSKENPDYLSNTFLQKLDKTLPWSPNRRFIEHFEKLDSLATNRALLVEGSDAPTSTALARARAILQQLETEGLEPTRVVASAEGGVAICFVNGDNYSDIECLNSEEILGVTSNRRDHPNIWEIDPNPSSYIQAVARIREFLHGQAPAAHDAKGPAR
jgi:hypothetical protein